MNPAYFPGGGSYGGAITGAGLFLRSGTGATIFIGTATQTGGTEIDNGTLQIGNGGSAGMISGTIVNNGSVAFDLSGTATLSNVISGSGSLSQIGSGVVVISATNTYAGGTVINAGKLVINADAALGSGGVLINGGALGNTTNLISSKAITLGSSGGTIDASGGFFSINNTISGSGGLTKTGSKVLTLSGAQTYTGATIVNGGILKFGANGPTASTVATSSLAIASGAEVIFSDSQTYAGNITGAGLLAHEFNGTTILTGTASQSGGTQIIGGTIQLGNGGTTGSLTGNVALSGGGILAFDRSDAVAFAGAISGTGGVTQMGSGKVTLLDDSSYSGGTTVAAGILMVEGNLSGTGTVNVTGGAIGGDGAIGGSLHFGPGTDLVFDPTKTLTINGATVTFDGFSVADLFGLNSTVANGIYALLDGPAAFNFANVANFGAGHAYDLGNGKFAYFQAGSLDLVVGPEPGTWALLLLGSSVLWAWRRRRASASRRESIYH